MSGLSQSLVNLFFLLTYYVFCKPGLPQKPNAVMFLCFPDINHLFHSLCPEFDHSVKEWQPHAPVSVAGLAWPV